MDGPFPAPAASIGSLDMTSARYLTALSACKIIRLLVNFPIKRRSLMCLAIPGRVTEVYEEHGVLMGKVDFGGVAKRVCLEHVPEIHVGEYAIVHVGFAISRINADEATQVFKFLEDMNELAELES